MDPPSCRGTSSNPSTNFCNRERTTGPPELQLYKKYYFDTSFIANNLGPRHPPLNFPTIIWHLGGIKGEVKGTLIHRNKRLVGLQRVFEGKNNSIIFIRWKIERKQKKKKDREKKQKRGKHSSHSSRYPIFIMGGRIREKIIFLSETTLLFTVTIFETKQFVNKVTLSLFVLLTYLHTKSIQHNFTTGPW